MALNCVNCVELKLNPKPGGVAPDFAQEFFAGPKPTFQPDVPQSALKVNLTV
jgi:hypothetical protein